MILLPGREWFTRPGLFLFFMAKCVLPTAKVRVCFRSPSCTYQHQGGAQCARNCREWNYFWQPFWLSWMICLSCRFSTSTSVRSGHKLTTTPNAGKPCVRTAADRGTGAHVRNELRRDEWKITISHHWSTTRTPSSWSWTQPSPAFTEFRGGIPVSATPATGRGLSKAPPNRSKVVSWVNPLTSQARFTPALLFLSLILYSIFTHSSSVFSIL